MATMTIDTGITLVLGSKSNEVLGTLSGHYPKTVLSRQLADAGRVGLMVDVKGKRIIPTGPRVFVDAVPHHERALTVRESLSFALAMSGQAKASSVPSWLSAASSSAIEVSSNSASDAAAVAKATVEKLAESLSLGHLLETRIFFLSSVQTRCISLGQALLAANAHATRGAAEVKLLAEHALDGLCEADQAKVAQLLQSFTKATGVDVVISTADGAAMVDEALTSSVDHVLLVDTTFAVVYQGSPADLKGRLSPPEHLHGTLTAVKLLLQQKASEGTDSFRKAFSWSPPSSPVTKTETASKPAAASVKPSSPYLTPFFPSFGALVVRRWKVVSRSPVWIWPRPILSLVFALFLGSLYFQPPFSSFNIKASLASYITVLIAASSMVEARATVHSALSMHPSLDGKLFSSLAVLLSDWLVALPASIISSLILGLIPFYMVDYADSQGRAAFFLLIVFCVDQSFGVLMRATVQALLNKDSARMMSGMYVLFFLFCGGFFIVPSLANPAYYTLF
jgi:ABC-2 type transporter